MGVNSSQATASWALNEAFLSMVLAEQASSAPTSRPCRDTQASCLLGFTGSLGCIKQLESRRGEDETEGGNGVREKGGTLGLNPDSSSSKSMIEACV